MLQVLWVNSLTSGNPGATAQVSCGCGLGLLEYAVDGDTFGSFFVTVAPGIFDYQTLRQGGPEPSLPAVGYRVGNSQEDYESNYAKGEGCEGLEFGREFCCHVGCGFGLQFRARNLSFSSRQRGRESRPERSRNNQAPQGGWLNGKGRCAVPRRQ